MMRAMLPRSGRRDRRIVEPDERQEHHADERREQQQHGDVALLEVPLDQILVQVRRDRPEDRARKREEEPGQFLISRCALAEIVARLPLRRRVDVQVNDANAAFLEHVDALLDGRLDVGRLRHRADADGALRLRELGDVRLRILHTQSDPAVFHLASAGAGYVVLVQFIVEIGPIVIHQDQERNLVMGRAPDRRRAHAKIPVAEHRDRVTALVLQGERRADRHART